MKNDLTLIMGYVFSLFGMVLAMITGSKKLTKTFLYASFIRTALETSIEVIIFGLQELYYFPGWEAIPSMPNGNITSLIVSVLLILVQIAIIISMQKYIHLKKGISAGRSQAFFDELRHNPNSRYYHFIFILRRFSLAIVLVFWKNAPPYQIQMF
jgi:hypothetical protein